MHNCRQRKTSNASGGLKTPAVPKIRVSSENGPFSRNPNPERSDTVSRVPMLESGADDPVVNHLFDHASVLLNRIPNAWRVMANQPYITKFMLPLTSSLLRQGLGSALDTKTKELAIINTSRLNNCAY